jgi:hypothetical protein
MTIQLPILAGDTPKKSIKDDEFGCERTVSAIAKALIEQVNSDGYILGIEGVWGSGKSSYANFIAEEIKRRCPTHEIIRFEPWLVGERTAFLPACLGQLALRIENVEKATAPWWRIDRFVMRRRRRLANKIRKYGTYASVLAAPAGSIAPGDPTGTVALTAVGLRGFGAVSKLLGNAPTFEKLKEEISTDIRRLQKVRPGLRFVVIIDDTDRLEPAEALEVLRLIRKVVDFPLITYLLCFDQNVLAGQVCAAAQIQDGHVFVEKIFQNVVAIPPQEPFALRRYLRKLLQEAFGKDLESSRKRERDAPYREHIVLNLWVGKLVHTPRDVVRLFEAVKLGWPHLPDGCDFLDFLWLQLIKLKHEKLYGWTVYYLTNIGSFRDGGRPDDQDAAVQAESLFKMMSDLHWVRRSYESGLSYILPGTDGFVLDGEGRKVFSFEHGELARFELHRRLGSPTHWRQYFAFDLPSYAISDEYISAFRASLRSNAEDASLRLLELAGKDHSRRGHFLDVLLDRLLDAVGPERLTKDEVSGLATACASSMDEVAGKTKAFEHAGQSEIWLKSIRLLNKDAADTICELVRSGRSLNWLAEVLRDQGFAQGRPEGRSDPERQWLTKEQFERCIAEYTRRLENTPAREIFEAPYPLDILFLWVQLGDAKKARTYFAKATRTTQGLLDGLDAMRGWSNSSSNGVRHPVYRDYVAMFGDAEEFKNRLSKAASRESSSDLRNRATQLLNDWSDMKMA